MIRIVIIDNPEECRNLYNYLSRQKDFKIVGIGSSGYEAVKLANSRKPDIILLNNIPEDEVKTALLIKARFPGTAIIMNSDDEQRIFFGFSNGISGCVTKKINPELLSHAIRMVYHGGCLIATGMAAVLFDTAVRLSVLKSRGELRSSSEEAAPTGINKLPLTVSSSEMELMSFIGRGYTNREIAQKLRLSEGTIRNRISSVLHKTGLHDRTQVALYAFKAGL